MSKPSRETLSADALDHWPTRPFTLFFSIALIITAGRILGLVAADANLGPDEAQYWFWSKEPAFGYFSKPPLIAWAIAGTTAAFGDAEWAVRLSAPLFHLGAAVFLFALARQLYGAAVGFWVGVGWLTLPGVSFSAALITTDAPLLFFWSAALLCFFRSVNAASDKAAFAAMLGVGAFTGFGLLAKYAMIYFVIGAALAIAFAPEARKRISWPGAGLGLAMAVAIVAPNLVWNASHDFQTLAHTAANANWAGEIFHPLKLLEFLAAQFGIFGPALAALLVWGGATFANRLDITSEARRNEIMLMCFALPPLLIVSAQALISRAHANWAAAAYPAALVLVVAWAQRARLFGLVKGSVAVHAMIGAGFVIGVSNFALADAVGLSGAVKRVRGWEEQGAAIRAAAADFDTIIVDDRELMGSLLYYARGGPPIRAWNSNGRIDDHYEAFYAFDPAMSEMAIFVSPSAEAQAVTGRFSKVRPERAVNAALGPAGSRTLHTFSVSGYTER